MQVKKSFFHSKRSIIIVSLIFVALGVASRFAPHAWNFTPVAAIGIAATAYLGFGYSAIITVIIMALSDIRLGYYDFRIMVAVYGSLILCALIGMFLKKKRTVVSVAIASISCSLIFFVITNAAVWQFSGMYAHSLSGLSLCFTAAIPFFRGTILGDLFFTGFIFGVFESVVRIASSYRRHALFGR